MKSFCCCNRAWTCKSSSVSFWVLLLTGTLEAYFKKNQYNPKIWKQTLYNYWLLFPSSASLKCTYSFTNSWNTIQRWWRLKSTYTSKVLQSSFTDQSKHFILQGAFNNAFSYSINFQFFYYFTSMTNLTCRSLECERKLEYQPRNHIGTGEHAPLTWKDLDGVQSRNLLAVKWPLQPLHPCAAKDMHVQFISHSKLATGVKVSMNDFNRLANCAL